VLRPHVHVPCRIGGVALPAVVQARELLLQVTSATTHMLFPELFALLEACWAIALLVLRFFLVVETAQVFLRLAVGQAALAPVVD